MESKQEFFLNLFVSSPGKKPCAKDNLAKYIDANVKKHPVNIRKFRPGQFVFIKAVSPEKFSGQLKVWRLWGWWLIYLVIMPKKGNTSGAASFWCMLAPKLACQCRRGCSLSCKGRSSAQHRETTDSETTSSCLGAYNYVRDYLKDFSTVAAPLIE
jgi:hypothetical protein